jgi:hypothetical protein
MASQKTSSTWPDQMLCWKPDGSTLSNYIAYEKRIETHIIAKVFFDFSRISSSCTSDFESRLFQVLKRHARGFRLPGELST